MTPLQAITSHAGGFLFSGSLISNSRRRNSDSSRGKLNTPFSQFLDATRVVRKIIKYLFIIWALVLGIYLLFHYAGQAALRLPTEQDSAVAGTAVGSPTTSATVPAEDSTLAAIQTPIENSEPLNAQNTNRETTAVAPIAEPEQDTHEFVAEEPVADNEPVVEAEPASTAPDPDRLLKVTAYRAVLLDAIDRDDAKQTPLQKDSSVLFIQRIGEWIEVITTDTRQTGFIHSSQVVAE